MLIDNFPDDIPNDSLYTCNIATYELGSLVKCLVYARHHHVANQPKDENIYIAEAKIALCDLITQTRILAEQMQCDYEECLRNGEERFLERMEQVRDKHLH